MNERSFNTMEITVFGASGRTGVPLVEQALDAGHQVTAFVRDTSRFPMADESLTVIEGDVYTGEGVEAAVEGADAVLSVLGQTDSGPDDLLTVAGEHVMDAVEDHEVERYATLVGAGVRLEGESVSPVGRVSETLLKLLNPEVLRDAEEHVEDVRSRDIEWTVVRASRLSEAEPRGEYRTGDVEPGWKAVARADVADFLLTVVEDDQYVHDLPKITY
jgi:putative NADH-flavin reductase